jgi:hypothetical protein
MHVNLSWLKMEERLTSSLLVFVRSVDMLNALRCLLKLLAHRSDTHAYPTIHATKGLIRQEQIMGGAQYYIEPWLHGIIPHQVTDASSRIRFRTALSCWIPGRVAANGDP